MVERPSSLSRSIVSNAAVRLLGLGVSKLILMAITVYLARTTGSHVFGQYALVLAYLAFFWTIAEPGISPIVLQRLQAASPDEESSIVGSALGLKAVLSASAVILAWIIMVLVGFPSDLHAAVVVGSLGILASTGDVFATVFQARFVQKYSAAAEAAEQLVFALLAIIVLSTGMGLAAILGAVALGNWARMAVAAWISSRFVVLRIRLDIVFAREILKRSLPILVMGIGSTILASVDILMLQKIAGTEQVGYYSAAKRLVVPWGLLAGAYVAALYPHLHQLFQDNAWDRFTKAYELSFKYLLTFGALLAAATGLLATRIIDLLYGAEYAPAAPALAILIWTQVFLFAKIVNDYIFIATGRQLLALTLLVIVAVSNVVLNALLIPLYGNLGAAMAAIISLAVYFVLELAIPAARPYALAFAVHGWKPLLAAAAMVALALLVFRPSAGWIVAPALPAAYIGVLILLRGVDRSDLVRVRHMLLFHRA